jgi:hypothetical protein
MSQRSPSRRRTRVATAERAARVRAPAAPPPAVANLARALVALGHGLSNPASESTDAFHQFVAPFPDGSALDGAAFQRALRLGSRYKVDLSPADDMFSTVENPANNDGDTAQQFHVLHTVMSATLTDISTAFARGANVVRVRMWLFGRMKGGWLVGLRSESTET